MSIYRFIKAWTIGVIIGSSISGLIGVWNNFSTIWLISWLVIWGVAEIIKSKKYEKN